MFAGGNDVEYYFFLMIVESEGSSHDFFNDSKGSAVDVFYWKSECTWFCGDGVGSDEALVDE